MSSCLGDFRGHGKVLLVWNRENCARNLGICEHRLQIGDGTHAELPLECQAFFFGAAEASDDFYFFRLGHGAGEDLGPAAETDDADFDGFYFHDGDILLNPGIETEKHLPAAIPVHPHAGIEKCFCILALLMGNHHNGVSKVNHLSGE